MRERVVGILGGGQLGRMLVEAANDLDIRVNVLDKGIGPAKQVSNHDGHIDGAFSDPDAIRRLAKTCDIMTVEIEHVDADALEEVSLDVAVEPSPQTLKLIQNKFRQKQHLKQRGIPVAPFEEIREVSEAAIEAIGESFKYPFMLKSQTQAYDGRGNYPVRSAQDIGAAIEALGNRPLYAERWSRFTRELAVIVVKTRDGVLSYPTVETVHEDSICKLVFCPARGISRTIDRRAQELARDSVATFEGKGVFGVEMFLEGDVNPRLGLVEEEAEILVNEVAPRPHNSGHHTIEACHLSQYDSHIRAILDMPIAPGDVEMKVPATIMLNILGGSLPHSHLEVRDAVSKLRIPGARVHLYGKSEAKPGRKMGHVTVSGRDMHSCERAIKPLVDIVDEIRASRTDVPPSTAPRFTVSDPGALVAICMGSASDLPVLAPGIELLERIGVAKEVHVTSAHRTPDWMREYAMSAESRGIRVIIAAAGGAAHLPGMMASWTSLPVIGLPVRGSQLAGVDSLLSILMMPRGEPVLTVGINNAVNAALGAVRILGLGDERIKGSLQSHAEEASDAALESDARIQAAGWRATLEKIRDG